LKPSTKQFLWGSLGTLASLAVVWGGYLWMAILAGPSHPISTEADEDGRFPINEHLRLRDWLEPLLFGAAVFAFSCLLFSFYHRFFLADIGNSIVPEERDNVRRRQRTGVRRTALAAGIAVAAYSYMQHGNYFGCGIILVAIIVFHERFFVV